MDVTKGHEAVVALRCGCTTRGSGASLIARCAEATRLRAKLIDARDELQANERSGSRVGRKPAINAFAAARDEYQRHWRGGSR